jgi:hypothetical protein
MREALVVQGRRLEPEDIEGIRRLMADHPRWSRRRISEALAAEWDWRNGAGRLKDMATRALLLKLEARGLIRLPARRRAASSRMASGRPRPVGWDRSPIRGRLADLGPLEIREVSGDESAREELASALAEFHYLGHRGTVGENLHYTVRCGRGRFLAGALFGAAAWKCGARDRWIGWSPKQRARGLHLLTNNTRFLVAPWVEVPHLASWMLGRVLRRLSADWRRKYGHPVLLVETFVEAGRFAGTCYRAANWVRVGATAGRGRQDRDRRLRVPVKDVYLYPLGRDVRRGLRR